MKENKLVELSKQFAVDVVNLCAEIKEKRKGNVLLNQLLRSGTSIGANIHEANYAASKPDFINKFQIALKECYESDYWLGLFKDTKMITEQEYKEMYDKLLNLQRETFEVMFRCGFYKLEEAGEIKVTEKYQTLLEEQEKIEGE